MPVSALLKGTTGWLCCGVRALLRGVCICAGVGACGCFVCVHFFVWVRARVRACACVCACVCMSVCACACVERGMTGKLCQLVSGSGTTKTLGVPSPPLQMPTQLCH